jgi:hypothetical protein
MPSFDPIEIQRLNDRTRPEATSVDQACSVKEEDESRHAQVPRASGERCQVIEIASFQPRLARPRLTD